LTKVKNKQRKIDRTMRNITTSLRFIASVILSFALFTSSYSQNENSKPFKQRSYYTKIFDAKTIKKLQSIEKKSAKGDKLMTVADSLLRSANKFKQSATATTNAKTRETYNKNAAKVELKSFKKQKKAIGKFHTANIKKFDIYRTHLDKVRVKDSSEVARQGQLLESQALNRYNKALKIRREAETLPLKDMVNRFWGADGEETTAITIQEEAFHVYMIPPTIKVDTIKENGKITIKKDTVRVFDNSKGNAVDIFVDPNNTGDLKENLSELVVYHSTAKDEVLYASKHKELFPKFKLGKVEQAEYEHLQKLLAQADSLQKEGNAKLERAKLLRNNAGKEIDMAKQTSLKKEADVSDKEAFDLFIAGFDKKLLAYEILINLYQRNSESVRPKTGSIQAGLDLEKESQNLMQKTYEMYQQAKLKIYKTDKYKAFFEALKTRLSAVEKQESAIISYTTLVVKTVVPNPDKLIDILDPEVLSISEDKAKNSAGGKLVFDLKETKTYSKSAPKPVLAGNVKGIVFRVQAGLFDKDMPPTTFADIQPYFSETFKSNNFIRTLIGNFKTKAGAETALKDVQKKYKDSYIVAYNNGSRISADDGVKLLVKKLGENGYKELETAELAELSGKPIPVELGKVTDISTIKGLMYTVRVGAFKNDADLKKLAFVSPLLTDKTDKLLMFFTAGIYNNYTAAESARKQIVQAGVTDAYVVAYYNGKQVADAALNKLLNADNTPFTQPTPVKISGKATVIVSDNSNKKTEPVKDNVRYTVQLGSYSKEVSGGTDANIEKAGKYAKVEKITLHDSTILYVSGDFDSYKEADKHKKELDSKAVSSFIVALKGSKKISLADAKKVLKN